MFCLQKSQRGLDHIIAGSKVYLAVCSKLYIVHAGSQNFCLIRSIKVRSFLTKLPTNSLVPSPLTASFSGIFFTDLFSLIHVLNEDVACVTKPSQLDEMPLSSSPINKLENKFHWVKHSVQASLTCYWCVHYLSIWPWVVHKDVNNLIMLAI